MNDEQQIEDANFAACTAAFVAMYPAKPSFVANNCEDGEWQCATCPWKPKEGWEQ